MTVRLAPGLGPVNDAPTPRPRVGLPVWYQGRRPPFDGPESYPFALMGSVKLGNAHWAYPLGSETRFYDHAGVRTLIVRLADGSFHLLTEAGEVHGLPASVLADMRRRFSGPE